MDNLEEWMKKAVYLYLLLHALTQLAGKEQYGKYIRFFAGLIFVVFFLTPVWSWLNGTDSLLDQIDSAQYRQELQEWKKDMSKMEYLNEEYYQQEYAREIEEQVQGMVEKEGLVCGQQEVELNESYEINSISLKISGDGGKGDSLASSYLEQEAVKLEQIITEEYQLEEGVVEIAF